jgi:RNA polymerase sigma-70 factor (ECF subfamily)
MKTSDDEQGLLNRWRKGDVSSFDSFCRQVEAPLFTYARQLVNDRCEAEDIAQEALLRLYVAAREGKASASPRAYVFSVAHNLAVDHLRRLRRSATTSSSPDARVGRKDVSSVPASQSLLREEIGKALATLPDTQRFAILLREFGDLNYAEISQTLGISLDQVKVSIHRARKRLAQTLDQYGQFVGGQARGA